MSVVAFVFPACLLTVSGRGKKGRARVARARISANWINANRRRRWGCAELSIITRIKRRTSLQHTRAILARCSRPPLERDRFDISPLNFAPSIANSLRLSRCLYSNSNNLRIHRHLVRALIWLLSGVLAPYHRRVLQLRGLQTASASRSIRLRRLVSSCLASPPRLVPTCGSRADLISTLRVSLLDSGSVDETCV